MSILKRTLHMSVQVAMVLSMTLGMGTVVNGSTENLPDFASIQDVRQKKQAFFDYINNFVAEFNALMRAERQEVLTVEQRLKQTGHLSPEDQEWIEDMALDYELSLEDFATTQELISALLKRVDEIPASLVLSQAAVESAWGTSRFAVQGRNLFGQWCWRVGCGLIPSARPAGEIYEVKVFDSVAGSVEGYFTNINTHFAYEDLREIRSELREEQYPLDSLEIAEGLLSYSTEGTHYVEKIQGMISYNKLQENYDQYQ